MAVKTSTFELDPVIFAAVSRAGASYVVAAALRTHFSQATRLQGQSLGTLLAFEGIDLEMGPRFAKAQQCSTRL